MQIFAGIKPIPKLDLKASFTSARLDKDCSCNESESPRTSVDELDLTATYKIYDNLSYMVGFAYLWAGDAFKGSNSSATVR